MVKKRGKRIPNRIRLIKLSHIAKIAVCVANIRKKEKDVMESLFPSLKG